MLLSPVALTTIMLCSPQKVSHKSTAFTEFIQIHCTGSPSLSGSILRFFYWFINGLYGLGPSFLSDLLLPYKPQWTLRSSGAGILTTPAVKTRTHDEATFSHDGPRLWNSLPENIRAAKNVNAFNRLKTYFSYSGCFLT